MIARLGSLLFRLRGWTPLPLLAALLALARPTPATLAAGCAVAAAGEALRIAALRHLDATSRGRRFHASQLVMQGPFGVVRHPVYAGNALLVAGLCTASGALRPLFLTVVAAGFALQYGAIIAREEAFLAERFPRDFPAYRARVPMLVPRRLGRRTDAAPRRALRAVVAGEFRTLQSLAIVLSLIVLKGALLAGPSP